VAARKHNGPSLICLRTDHEANLGVPAEMLARFFEVYNGPASAEADGVRRAQVADA
jgi:hypothetical protein